jgi:hypothetical protein
LMAPAASAPPSNASANAALADPRTIAPSSIVNVVA